MNTAFAVRTSQKATVVAGSASAFSVRSPESGTMLLRDQNALPVSVHSYTNLLPQQAAEVLSIAVEAKTIPQPQQTPEIVQMERSGMFTILAGQRGPAGRHGLPGESNIAGYGFDIDQLNQGDMLVFNGSAWGNEHKTSLLDGGNF